MPEQVTAVWDRLARSVREFTVAQRTLALIGIAVVVLGLVAVTNLLSRQTMSPLFAGVSTTDASAIVDILTDEGVPYELADGGSTVLVPSSQLYPMRLTMAAAGLPTASDGGGYSLLDDMGMTSSEFQQQVTYQRALEGELAKTISAIDGVEAASVKLALPEESVFVSQTQDPTASVFLQVRPGTTLDTRQVEAVVHLVSAGIKGMKPTDVAVIDSQGVVLSAIGEGPGQSVNQRSTDYEARVAGTVQAMLDRVVGPGNAVVAVSAEMSHDVTERMSESFTAEEDVPPLSSTRTTEEYEGGRGGTATGVLGPDNIQVPAGQAEGGSYSKESETVNNAVNKVTESTTIPAGQLRRQSVSVVVDANAGAGIDIPQLTSMVSAAAGIDTERGDTVAVERVTFDTTTAEQAQEALAAAAAQERAERTAGLIRTGIIAGVIVLLVVLALITANRRAARARRQDVDLGELTIIEDDEPLELEGADADRAAIPPATAPAAPGAAPTLLDTINAKRAEVAALAEEQPGEVADLLRGWFAGSPR